MESEKRRDFIIEELKKNQKPIKGTDLAKRFNVSRQVIVQDIAILRAKGEEILATPQGYMIMTSSYNQKLTKVIVCKHNEHREIEEELQIIVDMGGKIIDVIVEHPIYGEIKGLLMISSRIEVEEFMKSLKKEKAEPLAKLTDGVHLHTIEVPNEEIYRKILFHLEEKGYLINTK